MADVNIYKVNIVALECFQRPELSSDFNDVPLVREEDDHILSHKIILPGSSVTFHDVKIQLPVSGGVCE